MVKVTVLVAVYNSGAYLRECLESLMAQSFKDFQAVCVDDASTDNSWQILQEYAGKDSRFEVIHLDKNGGQAKARNVALSKARGVYTCFLDSDDFLSPDALESVVARFEEKQDFDCVLFRCLYLYPEERRLEAYAMEPFVSMSGQEAFVESLTWKIHGIYAVKTAIHQKYPYDDSLHSYSDDNTTRLHYLASREVSSCNGIYYYRQHGASVTHHVSLERLDYLKANAIMKQTLLRLEVDEELIGLYENHRWLNVVGLYQFAVMHRSSFSMDEWKEGMQVIRTAWASIETRRLDARNHIKWGYLLCRSSWMPLEWGWRLFRWEEDTYYLLRKIFHRLPHDV